MENRIIGLDSRPRKTKFDCPQCKANKTFTPFVYKDNFEYLSEAYKIDPIDGPGKCDKISNCGYELKPSEFFKNHGTRQSDTNYIAPTPRPTPQILYIHENTLIKTLERPYKLNNLVLYISRILNDNLPDNWREIVFKTAKSMRIGTSNLWANASIYWFIDLDLKICSGKIMAYNVSGNRVREPYMHVSSVHSQLQKKAEKEGKEFNFTHKHCLFNEFSLRMLLKLNDTKSKIYIVESEKTAFFLQCRFKDKYFIATSSMNNLNDYAIDVLNRFPNKKVLIPDCSNASLELKKDSYPLHAFEFWLIKCFNLKLNNYEIILDLQFRLSSLEERKQDFDIFDFYVKTNVDWVTLDSIFD